ARERATRLENWLGWERRSASRQTRTGLAGDQRDCTHAYAVGRGRSGPEEVLAPPIAFVWIRTACPLHNALRIAVAKIQQPQQDRHLRESAARQSPRVARCAKRCCQLERTAHGRMANWFLARRESAAAACGYVE